MKPKAVILSGGPASVHEKGAPLAPMAIFEAGVPVLGICYGEQAMAHQLGGKVEGGHHREFGRAEVEVAGRQPAVRRRVGEGPEISGLDEPRRPRHRAAAGLQGVGTAPNAPIAIIADEKRKFYATQFHLEVVHTPHGAALLRNFVRKIAGCSPATGPCAPSRTRRSTKIRAQVGKGG